MKSYYSVRTIKYMQLHQKLLEGKYKDKCKRNNKISSLEIGRGLDYLDFE